MSYKNVIKKVGIIICKRKYILNVYPISLYPDPRIHGKCVEMAFSFYLVSGVFWVDSELEAGC